MKYKHITIGFAAMSLIAMALVSTVAAVADYTYYMNTSKKANDITFSIPRNLNSGNPSIDSIDITRITLLIVPERGTDQFSYSVPPEMVVRDSIGISFTLDRRDLPVNHAQACWATGFVITGGVEYTFEAAGPGWGWGNVH
jgi:hypothetical protein